MFGSLLGPRTDSAFASDPDPAHDAAEERLDAAVSRRAALRLLAAFGLAAAGPAAFSPGAAGARRKKRPTKVKKDRGGASDQRESPGPGQLLDQDQGDLPDLSEDPIPNPATTTQPMAKGNRKQAVAQANAYISECFAGGGEPDVSVGENSIDVACNKGGKTQELCYWEPFPGTNSWVQVCLA